MIRRNSYILNIKIIILYFVYGRKMIHMKKMEGKDEKTHQINYSDKPNKITMTGLFTKEKIFAIKHNQFD